MAQDLNKPSKAIIADLINAKNGTSFAADTLGTGTPSENPEGSERNTDLEVWALSDDEDKVTIHYDRLDLAILFGGVNLEVPDNNFDNVSDLLPAINAAKGLGLTVDDIEALPIGAGAYPKSVLVKASPGCLVYFGQFSVSVTDSGEEPEDDTSFLTAPAVTNGGSVHANFQSGGFLLAGTGNPPGDLVLATNGEIQVAGGARIFDNPATIDPASGGAYQISIGAQDDWSFVHQFGLIDTRNGTVVTDLYDITLNVVAESTAEELNFVLSRTGSQFHFIDAANTIDITNGYGAPNGSVYQDIQRLSAYKAHLGAVDESAAGTPLGEYAFTLTAHRKNGSVPNVVVSFSANVVAAA